MLANLFSWLKHPKPRASQKQSDFKKEAFQNKKRNVVFAPVQDITQNTMPVKSHIPIKAVIDERIRTITFYTDRALLQQCSFSCRVDDPICTMSPLASKIFQAVGGVSICILNDSLTLGLGRKNKFPFEETARKTGAIIREHLESGAPILSDEFLNALPDEAIITQTLQAVLDQTLNPQIAGHGGSIALDRIEGNTVYIQMTGGCQGCAASHITLRTGIEKAFREAIPYLGAVIDDTDHNAGKNPYFTREEGVS